LHERSQDGVARIEVEAPEALRLCFRQLQAGHFVVFALNSLNYWREAAQSLLRGQYIFGCLGQHDLS
jgi:hypothetical protein